MWGIPPHAGYTTISLKGRTARPGIKEPEACIKRSIKDVPDSWGAKQDVHHETAPKKGIQVPVGNVWCEPTQVVIHEAGWCTNKTNEVSQLCFSIHRTKSQFKGQFHSDGVEHRWDEAWAHQRAHHDDHMACEHRKALRRGLLDGPRRGHNSGSRSFMEGRPPGTHNRGLVAKVQVLCRSAVRCAGAQANERDHRERKVFQAALGSGPGPLRAGSQLARILKECVARTAKCEGCSWKKDVRYGQTWVQAKGAHRITMDEYPEIFGGIRPCGKQKQACDEMQHKTTPDYGIKEPGKHISGCVMKVSCMHRILRGCNCEITYSVQVS